MLKQVDLRRHLVAAGAATLLIAGGQAAADQAKKSGDANIEKGQAIDLTMWSYTPLYAGWSADQLVDRAEIVDRDGAVVGNLEDLIVGPEGKVQKLVVGSGGFLGIGDTHFAYPWSQAKFIGRERIQVNLDEDKLEDYSFFKDIEGKPAKGDNWRITELMNDYAYLEGDVPYGTVDDVILGKSGELKAVIVYPDIRYRAPGPYAWPYYGGAYAFDPRRGYYEIPHSADEVATLKVFLYKPEEGENTGETMQES